MNAISTVNDISGAQWALLAVNVMLSIGGFVVTFMIQRLYKSVDQLYAQLGGMQREVTEHREDVLKNYACENDLITLRDSVFKRFDRFEDTMLRALQRSPTP